MINFSEPTIIFILSMIFAFILHELGHIIGFKVFNIKYKARFEKPLGYAITYNNKGLSPNKEKRIIFAGIYLGLIPIFLSAFYIYWLSSFIGVIIYLMGCKYDIDKLRELEV